VLVGSECEKQSEIGQVDVKDLSSCSTDVPESPPAFGECEEAASPIGAGAGPDAGAGMGVSGVAAPPQQLELASVSKEGCGSPAPDAHRQEAAAVALRQIVGFRLLPAAPVAAEKKGLQANSCAPAPDTRSAMDRAAEEQKLLLDEWESTLGAIRAAADSSSDGVEIEAATKCTSPHDECAGPSRLLLLERQLYETEARALALTQQNARLRKAAGVAPRSPAAS